MIMLLQVNVHMLKHNFKNYKKVKLKPDWSLFCTIFDYKMNFINENEVWIKVQLEDVFSE